MNTENVFNIKVDIYIWLFKVVNDYIRDVDVTPDLTS